MRNDYALRASCSIFSNSSVFDISDKAIIAWAQNWADRMGLVYPEVSMEQSPLGKLVNVKCTKKLQNAHFIIRALVYHGKYSRLAIVVSAPSSTYPTNEIMRFIKSANRIR